MPILCSSTDEVQSNATSTNRPQTFEPSSVSTSNNKACSIEDKMLRKWMLENVGATFTGNNMQQNQILILL